MVAEICRLETLKQHRIYITLIQLRILINKEDYLTLRQLVFDNLYFNMDIGLNFYVLLAFYSVLFLEWTKKQTGANKMELYFYLAVRNAFGIQGQSPIARP